MLKKGSTFLDFPNDPFIAEKMAEEQKKLFMIKRDVIKSEKKLVIKKNKSARRSRKDSFSNSLIAEAASEEEDSVSDGSAKKVKKESGEIDVWATMDIKPPTPPELLKVETVQPVNVLAAKLEELEK